MTNRHDARFKSRRVLVLNHFAALLGEPGGTRHVEMFSRLRGWQHLIIASSINHKTGKYRRREKGFLPVTTIAPGNREISRILSWVTYTISAACAGLRLRNLDLVYASTPHLFAPIAGRIIARLHRVPMVLEVRDVWPQVLVDMNRLQTSSLAFRILRRLELWLYRGADAIVAMAPGTMVHLARSGVAAGIIHYIPNGADVADFDVTETREELRRRYGFTTTTAIYTGAHGPANGLNLLLDALAQLRDLDLEVALVGDGPQKERLIEQARELRLQNVRFFDPVPKAEIPKLLRAADIGCHVLADVPLFRTSVSPNKVYDYMAAGLPVVTNSPGLVADLVLEAGAGWAGQPDDLAALLRDAAAHGPSERRRLGAQGLEWLRSNQSRSEMTQRLESLISKVTSDRERPAQ